MTNQSREAFEKWRRENWPDTESRSAFDAAMWESWQAALSEGRRLGIEEAIQVCKCDFEERFPDLYREFMLDEIENAEDLIAAALCGLIDKRSKDGGGMGPLQAEKSGDAL